MTGFTRASGRHGATGWTWEIRSVNGKGLDLRVRLPSGQEALEAIVRELTSKCIKRGSIAVSLALERAAGEAALRVNREFLDRLLELSAELGGDARLTGEPPSLDALLAVRGVIEAAEADEDEAETAARQKAMAETLQGALEALVGVRATEGARLAAILGERLDEMTALCGQAESAAATRSDAIRERLKAQLDELLDMSPALSEERLAQEAALLAVKADIREELDRLGAHLSAARDLLAEGGAIGRKLDFLCQEFNRETNTLCSKSSDIELTRIGLALKAAIDQFREQALNIE
jgi:uncharacterized protein (TIGR00255 family)